MRTKIFLMVTAITMLIFSCSKEAGIIEQASIDLADDDAVSEAVFEDVFNTVDYADIILGRMIKGDDVKSGTVIGDTCPVITVTHPSDGIWPKVITIDFGAGCVGLFDNSRSGKIIISVSGPRLETGSKKTVTFENYHFNSIQLEGTKVFEYLGLNNNQNPLFSVRLTDGKLILPDGKSIERSFEHQREWVAGFQTMNIWDDECLVTGSANGLTINGVAYTNTITTALSWTRVCKFIVSGVVKFEREGLLPVEIDYGTGDCDAKATLTRGGESKEILLRHRHRLLNN